MHDCRTCAHSAVMHGVTRCQSTAKCSDGDQYAASAPVVLWAHSQPRNPRLGIRTCELDPELCEAWSPCGLRDLTLRDIERDGVRLIVTDAVGGA